MCRLAATSDRRNPPAQRTRRHRRGVTLWQVLGVVELFLGYRQWKLTRLNRRLVLAHNAADLANRAKGDFLANMSHEIRTPLNAVLNLAWRGLCARDPERLRGYLEGIQAASRSLLEVVNEVLDFSRLEDRVQTLNPAPFRFADLIERVLAIAAPLAVQKGLTLETELDPQLEGIWRASGSAMPTSSSGCW